MRRALGWLTVAATVAAVGCSKTHENRNTDAGDPGVYAPPIPTDAQLPKPFPFSSGTDATSVALNDTLRADEMAPDSQEEVDAARALSEQAAARLAADPDGATETLVSALSSIADDDVERRGTVFNLLGRVGTDRALAQLRTEALRLPVAPPLTDAGVEAGPYARKKLVQQLAVHGLRLAAVQGRVNARAQLLDLVELADPDLRANVVEAVYAASPQRWRAKREMALRIPRADLSLLTSVTP